MSTMNVGWRGLKRWQDSKGWTSCCRSIPSPSWLLPWICDGFKSQTFPNWSDLLPRAGYLTFPISQNPFGRGGFSCVGCMRPVFCCSSTSLDAAAVLLFLLLPLLYALVPPAGVLANQRIQSGTRPPTSLLDLPTCFKFKSQWSPQFAQQGLETEQKHLT